MIVLSELTHPFSSDKRSAVWVCELRTSGPSDRRGSPSHGDACIWKYSNIGM